MGFRLETYIVGLLVFALFIIVGTMTINDIGNNYNISISNNDSFNKTFNTANRIINDTQTTTGAMQTDVDGDIDQDSVEDSMFKGVFKAARKIFGIFNLPGNVISDIVKAVGLPDIFAKVANLAIYVVVLFSIIYLVFRFKPS